MLRVSEDQSVVVRFIIRGRVGRLLLDHRYSSCMSHSNFLIFLLEGNSLHDEPNIRLRDFYIFLKDMIDVSWCAGNKYIVLGSTCVIAMVLCFGHVFQSIMGRAIQMFSSAD